MANKETDHPEEAVGQRIASASEDQTACVWLLDQFPEAVKEQRAIPQP